MVDGKSVLNIVEITGVPGSGKSSLLSDSHGVLPMGWAVYEDGDSARKFNSKKANQVLVLFYYLYALLDRPKLILKLTLQILKIMKALREPPKVKLYLLVNIFLKIGRYEKMRRRNRVNGFVVDEGVTHIPFNLVSYRSGIVDTDLFNKDELGKLILLLAKCFNSINVIMVRCEESELVRRLGKRGHKRLDKSDVGQFVQVNSRLEELMIEIYSANFKNFMCFDAMTATGSDLRAKLQELDNGR